LEESGLKNKESQPEEVSIGKCVCGFLKLGNVFEWVVIIILCNAKMKLILK
jgi:hypothetical protein